jgi:topoisomerase-4 subunit A
MLEIDENDKIIDILEHKAGQKYLLASRHGKGFIVQSEDVLAQTKSGKIIMNIANDDEAIILRLLKPTDTHVAVIGDNRKLLIFTIDQLPVMKRGQGVSLQKYKDSGLSDLICFNEEQGLTWRYGNGVKQETNFSFWLGKRASAGKLPPTGFPRNNKF